ncbi:MAG: NAD(P)-binding domain-containing protein [bacterium]|nr:NAD(P)-binding domain-containing protein [bacterium]
MIYKEQKIGIIGCGWFGLPLGESLVNKGYQVNGSTRSIGKFPRLRKVGINPYRIDLSDIDDKAIDSFLAIDTLVFTVPPSKQNSSIQKQLQNLRNHIIEQNREIKIIFISSSSVYPNSNKIVVETEAQYIPTPRSGLILLELEEIFSKSSLNTTVVRFGGLFGPDRNPGRFLSNKGEIAGAGNPVNMIHLDDCIGVVEFLIENETNDETYNACSPDHPTKKDFYDIASKALGITPPAFNKKGTDFKQISASKILEAGYTFKYSNPTEALK